MGTYLNSGNRDFQISKDTKIFVDKTDMIRYLNSVVNTRQRYVSVSRPRRFGKTMAAEMICAYYDRTAESTDLFSQSKLANSQCKDAFFDQGAWDRYLGTFDVIHLVMTDFIKTERAVTESLAIICKRLLLELSETYPNVSYDSSDLFYSMDRFYRSTGVPFVLVIDEWDAVFRIRQTDTIGQKAYLDFLRDWIKDKSYIALAYMTGILPIKKYGKHSALNMFTEYSMMFPQELAQYSGFTTSEVQALCNRYGRDFEAIKEWYDGYSVSDIIPPDPDHKELKETGQSPKAAGYALYNPLSVVEAIRTGSIRDYWNKTETYEALAQYISKDYDGLQDAIALLMDGGRIVIDTSTYQNDMTTFHGKDDVLSLLVHLGYLGFDSERSEVFIPNREILDEFSSSTKSPEWIETFKSFEISQRLLQATWDKRSDYVAELLEDAHNLASNKTYHDEAALSYAIQYAYYAAQKYYSTIVELDAGKGYVDIAYLPSPRYPDKPALVIELTYNKTADTAIEQIKRQKYPNRFNHYRGNILLVGINYDRDAPRTSPEFKHHHCIIEAA